MNMAAEGEDVGGAVGMEFVGPHGGISKAGLKDDRLAVGNEVTLVLSGKSLKEIHLPYRARSGSAAK